MKKLTFKITAIILILLSVMTILISCSSKTDKEVLKNANFATASDASTTTITEWQAFNAKEDSNKYIQKKNDKIVFNSTKEITSYLFQEVTLEKGYYIVEANINLETNFDGYDKKGDKTPGLSIGILNNDNNVIGIKTAKATGGWVNVKKAFYVENKAKYTFVVGIGVDNQTGKAKGFANVKSTSLKQTTKEKAALAGLTDSPVGKGYNSSVYNNNANSIALASVGSIITLALFIVFGIFLAKKVRKPSKEELDNFVSKEKIPFSTKSHKDRFKTIISSTPFIISMITILAFLVRFVFIATMPMLYQNLTQYIKVASGMADKGIFVAYTDLGTSLEVGYLYLFYFIGAFSKAVHLSSTTFGFSMLLRLPDLIAEILICYIIFVILLEKTSRNRAIIGSLIYAIVPAFYFSSVLNGRISSVGILFILLALLSLMKNKYHMVSVYYFIGSIFEYSLVVFAPLLIVIFIVATIKNKSEDLKYQILFGFLFSMIGFIILALPFDYELLKQGKAFYFLTIIGKNLTEAKLLSPSTFNLYGLFGFSRATATLALTLLTGLVVAIVYGLYVYRYYLAKDNNNIMLLTGYAFALIGIIGAMVTPIFTYIAMVLLFVYSLINRERRIFSAVAAIGTLLTINELYIYSISGTLTKNLSKIVLINAYDPLYMFFSFLMLVAFIYLSYVTYTILIKNKECNFTDDIFKKEYIKNRLTEMKIQFTKKIKKEEKKIQGQKINHKNNKRK